MAKKNKSRKARKQADQKLQKMKVGHLVQKGEALLASGNFREALKTIKMAHQKQPADQPIPLNLNGILKIKAVEKDSDKHIMPC
ncbi:uncharacterized protein Dvar_73540 [Desulfosarcina variabilis str. Montpellier]|uniref:hypothetical protein n=1 Tax=Desulfosarcina variabilis TaxID=2300 RepID=UPI003AFAF6F2